MITPEAFRERFALATYSDGGVVADLTTGGYARVNATAARMFEMLSRARDFDAALDAIAAHFEIPVARAASDLGALLRALAREGVRTEAPDDLRYRLAADGGYELWHGELLALHVDAAGERMSLRAPPETLPLDIYKYVSDLAPKVMFLQGTAVLHGSSWHDGRQVMGLCGKSRAGKTTTARTLAKHAGTLVSEDLLVLGPDSSHPAVIVGAEARFTEWSRAAARDLRSQGASVDASPLRDAAIGEALPLERLWFLDAQRRGPAFQTTELSRARGLVELMAHGFLGAAGHANWRHHLTTGQALIGGLRSFEVALPDGLERLDAAMQIYATNSAS